jgi:L-ascorbate metabolism protein UlaG (beta-lactamase superfamily)
LLIELDGVRVLTDPCLRSHVLHIRRRVPVPRVEELVPLDALLVSHAHHDHLDPPSIRQVAGGCPVIVPRGCEGILRRRGVLEVLEVEAGDRIPLGDVVVEAVRALHDGRRYPFGRRRPALGYLLEGETGIYFAGDTDLDPEMARLSGRVDVAALPVAGWGPRIPPGHLDPERAARAAALIAPRIAIPIHWGTFAAIGARRSADPSAPAREFARAVEQIAPHVEVRVLAPGERVSVLSGDD